MPLGADFEISKTPAAPGAIGLAAKKVTVPVVSGGALLARWETDNHIARKSKNIRELAANSKNLMELSHGVGWHVAVGTDLAVDLRYRKGSCILLSSRGSKIKVLLYRTVPAQTAIPTEDYEALRTLENARESQKSSTQKKQLKEKVAVNECDMEPEMKERVFEIAKQLLEHYHIDPDVDSKVAFALKHSLTFRYGHTWHTIVSTSRELCCLPHFIPTTLADISIDKFRIVVYQHGGAPLDTRMDLMQFGNRAALLLAGVSLLIYGYFVYTATELDRNCVSTKDEAGKTLVAVGCKLKDVVQANTLAAWKGMAFFGTVLFTILASSLRIYRSTLRKAKQA